MVVLLHGVVYIEPMKQLPTPIEWSIEVTSEMKRKRVTARRLSKDMNVPYATLTRWLRDGVSDMNNANRVIKALEAI